MPLAPDDQLQVMHILQEALSNVRKHAGASKVEVELTRGPGYSFAVRDDGRGFDPARPPDDAADHVGLRIMRERAARIGARVDVRLRAGRRHRGPPAPAGRRSARRRDGRPAPPRQARR